MDMVTTEKIMTVTGENLELFYVTCNCTNLMICKWYIRLWKQFLCVDQSLSADTSGHVHEPLDKDFDTCGCRCSYIKISGNKFDETIQIIPVT